MKKSIFFSLLFLLFNISCSNINLSTHKLSKEPKGFWTITILINGIEQIYYSIDQSNFMRYSCSNDSMSHYEGIEGFVKDSISMDIYNCVHSIINKFSFEDNKDNIKICGGTHITISIEIKDKILSIGFINPNESNKSLFVLLNKLKYYKDIIKQNKS